MLACEAISHAIVHIHFYSNHNRVIIYRVYVTYRGLMHQESKKVTFDCETGRLYSPSGAYIAKLNYSERLIMQHFVSNAGCIIKKDLLLSVGWPGRVVVPNSLNIAIRSIRDALALAGINGEPETIPKQGYRFGVSVVVAYANTQTPTDEDTETLSHAEVVDDENSHDNFLLEPLDVNSSIKEISDAPPIKTDFKKKIKSLIARSYIYKAYLVINFLIFLYLYFYINMNSPSLVCSEVNKTTFCGFERVNSLLVSEELLGGGVYWFAEMEDGKYEFVKIN